MKRLCIAMILIPFLVGCAAYSRSRWTPDGFNYTVSRDRRTGDQTDYFGVSWNLKP